MTATIVVGTNSYATEAESATILEEFVHAGNWAFALNRVPALITAFYDISQFTLTDPVTGVVIDPSAAPSPIKQAQSLLAFEYSQKPALATASGHGGTNISSVKAGSAQVQFFRPEDKSRFPTLVLRLLAPYLGIGSGVLGSYASGTGASTSFKSGGEEGLTESFK